MVKYKDELQDRNEKQKLIFKSNVNIARGCGKYSGFIKVKS